MTHPIALPPRIPLTLLQRLRARTAARTATHLPPKRSIDRLARRFVKPATLAQAEHAVTAVTTATPRLGGTTACLPRALAAALYCQAAHRTTPTLVIGVRPGTSQVHAWIEAQGTPAGEPSNPRLLYVPVRTHLA